MLAIRKNSGVVITKDKVNIAYDHLKRGSASVVIVCPGFFNSKNNRWMAKAAELASSEYDVIIFDFRGHGNSAGKFSWSAREHLDLEAVLNYALSYGYRNIGILAFSLGAAAAVNLSSRRNEVKSMVLISCPLSFWKIDYHFWLPEMFSDLKDNFDCDWEGKGARVGSMLMPKPKPVKNIARIKDASVFFIHGERDWVIKPYHSQVLYKAAKVNKKIEIIKDGLHAERLIQQCPDKMKDLIIAWFSNTLLK